ncbi:sensor domain-containing diguanylate cyclase [Photobacterium satsumensis]|uniref:sensor domain-containing diguanylate cyclase n=1 Tax=Photobacterium satsumensis TaxID=2910239 RepID=UPI003D0CB524
MGKTVNRELDTLVEQLVRQENMSQWCQKLLVTLQNNFHLQNMTFMIEQESEIIVVASWVDGVFDYYSAGLSLDEYNGVPLGPIQFARDSGQFVRTYVNRPYKAIWYDTCGDWCQLVLPIIMHDRPVGYIYAETDKPEYFEARLKEVENFFAVIASDVSARVLLKELDSQHQCRQSAEAELALRNQSLKQYLILLKNLHELTLSLSKVTTSDELFKTAVRLGREKLDIDRVAVFLIDFDKNEMRGTYGTDPEGQLVCRRSFCSAVPDHPLVNEALSRKDHVVVKENAPLYYGTEQVGTGWNAMIAMWNGDHCIGWIAADNLLKRQPITEHGKQIFKLFGAALAQQIVIHQQYEELRQLNLQLEKRVNQRTQELLATNEALEAANQKLECWSMQDGLTQVSNRRFFDAAYQRLWQEAKGNGTSLGIIMLDIDHFKAFNDFYGHLHGDACLKKIASMLDTLAGKYDGAVLSRFGGEEFACILPKCSQQQLVTLASDMVEGARLMKLEHRINQHGVITLSGGGCVMPSSTLHQCDVDTGAAACISQQPFFELSQAEEASQLINKADMALYRAKKAGRNQFCIYDSDILPL